MTQKVLVVIKHEEANVIRGIKVFFIYYTMLIILFSILGDSHHYPSPHHSSQSGYTFRCRSQADLSPLPHPSPHKHILPPQLRLPDNLRA